MQLPVPGERRPARSEPETVHRITSAQTPLSEQQRFRQRRYLISMTVRTACFLAAILASGWLRWAFIIGAVVLPYVAVVMANAGRENDEFTGPEPVPPSTPQIRSEPPDPYH